MSAATVISNLSESFSCYEQKALSSDAHEQYPTDPRTGFPLVSYEAAHARWFLLSDRHDELRAEYTKRCDVYEAKKTDKTFACMANAARACFDVEDILDALAAHLMLLNSDLGDAYATRTLQLKQLARREANLQHKLKNTKKASRVASIERQLARVNDKVSIIKVAMACDHV